MQVKMRVYFYGPPGESAAEQMEYAANCAGMISVFPEEEHKISLSSFPAVLTIYDHENEFIKTEGRLFPREVYAKDK